MNDRPDYDYTKDQCHIYELNNNFDCSQYNLDGLDENNLVVQKMIEEDERVCKKTFEGGIPKDNLIKSEQDIAQNIEERQVSQTTPTLPLSNREYKYDLAVGWNLIAIPLVLENNSVADLIDEFNSRGANITHISSFDEGKFKIFSKRIDEEGAEHVFGEEFEILPGRGYFIKNFQSAEVTLRGEAPEMSELSIDNGWNLVGFYNASVAEISGFALIDKINTKDIEVDTLSRYQDGNYYSLVINERTQYGRNFRIESEDGYWIKSKDGEGIITF